MNVSKKDKIKAKLAAKKEKLVAKLKGSNEVKKATTALAMVCVGLAICGCQSTPSRAQTQTIKDCTFYVMVPPAGQQTNSQPVAVGTVGDLFSQNMVIENSGTESLTPTQTVSPTTTLSYGVGGGDSLFSLVSSLKSLIYGSSGTTTTVSTSIPATATAGTDGTFTGLTTSACADGDCSSP